MARRLALVAVLATAGCAPSPVPANRRPPMSRTTAPTTTTFYAPPPEESRATTTSTTVPPATTTTAPPGVASNERAAAPPPPISHLPAAEASVARASWYARGTRTASGERFDPDGLTYAHLSHPFGTMTRFCHGGRCVVARCNDRGPAAWTGRTYDLSRGAFAAIAPLGAGVVTVTAEAA